MKAIVNTLIFTLHFIAFFVLFYFLSGEYLVSFMLFLLGLMGLGVVVKNRL